MEIKSQLSFDWNCDCISQFEMITKVLKSVKDWCLFDPRRIVRLIVLIVCFFVVLVQVIFD